MATRKPFKISAGRDEPFKGFVASSIAKLVEKGLLQLIFDLLLLMLTFIYFLH